MVRRTVCAAAEVPELVTNARYRESRARRLGALATTALVAEAELTPKPGLVDRRGSGAHLDMSVDVLLRSARAIEPAFIEMGRVAFGVSPGAGLRERLAHIGRSAELDMLRATSGVNAHRGAIWALGLLVAGAATGEEHAPVRRVAETAGAIACFADRFAPQASSHGRRARARYGAGGAAGEARSAFPHVVDVGLPALRAAVARGSDENVARVDALVAIIAKLGDTCLLHRGGQKALSGAQSGARAVVAAGGISARRGWLAFERLERQLLSANASPGGSADLLAATLFLSFLERL
ncbi:MAG: triphosphoribosyl-dephospho-CoA synthase [Candidatus Eremiobacteraeota bacterium]|nr:triphosphoribosyl-dephospho-CoA synthase [Candidatus Eremiobacteraeota bacterium]